jgi:hypothetical protein
LTDRIDFPADWPKVRSEFAGRRTNLAGWRFATLILSVRYSGPKTRRQDRIRAVRPFSRMRWVRCIFAAHGRPSTLAPCSGSVKSCLHESQCDPASHTHPIPKGTSPPRQTDVGIGPTRFRRLTSSRGPFLRSMPKRRAPGSGVLSISLRCCSASCEGQPLAS